MSHLRRDGIRAARSSPRSCGDAWQENGSAAVASVTEHLAEAVARVRAGGETGRAGIEGGGAGSAGSQELAWERCEEGGVGEVPSGNGPRSL
jgi:hypothetical protein